MTLSSEAFLTDFAALSDIGATPGGGVERQAASPADCLTRRWLAAWLIRNDFEVRFDRIGNQFGLAEFVPGAPFVLVGSHLDSQPLAGRFDGAYGVLAAAFAAARVASAVRDGDIKPRYNVAVVNWFNEEGSRFQPSMMGSSVFTGKLDIEVALATVDQHGINVEDALDEAGRDGNYDGPDAALYAEIHIEQGRALENDGISVGLVHQTWAANKYNVVVHGDQSHTGSTLMQDRHDALLGAALAIAAAREVCENFAPGQLHSSVSQLHVLPNSPVVVAREVRMNLDLRSPDEGVLARATKLLQERLPGIEAAARVTVDMIASHSWGLLSYQEEGVQMAAKVADELGLSHERVMTVAGHDSTNMKDIVPTVMLFVPSVEGISHNELEFTKDEDSVNGVDMMTGVTRRLVVGEIGGS